MRKPKLFLLHFAGGNAYSFQSITSLLEDDFEVIPLELPGRGKRIHESLIKDFEQAAFDYYNQIVKRTHLSSFVIYGHSMGAYLTLAITEMLEKIRKYPTCIFVSGNPGPGMSQGKRRYLMEQREFIEELKQMGGIANEFLDNEELFEFFEPILRADFEVVEKGEIRADILVNTPLYAMMGSEEPNSFKINNWSRFTLASFRSEIMEGDHFFIYKHPDKIARIIRDTYESLRGKNKLSLL
jgi:surfactin synthase thioesterase subunit